MGGRRKELEKKGRNLSVVEERRESERETNEKKPTWEDEKSGTCCTPSTQLDSWREGDSSRRHWERGREERRRNPSPLVVKKELGSKAGQRDDLMLKEMALSSFFQLFLRHTFRNENEDWVICQPLFPFYTLIPFSRGSNSSHPIKDEGSGQPWQTDRWSDAVRPDTEKLVCKEGE